MWLHCEGLLVLIHRTPCSFKMRHHHVLAMLHAYPKPFDASFRLFLGVIIWLFQSSRIRCRRRMSGSRRGNGSVKFPHSSGRPSGKIVKNSSLSRSWTVNLDLDFLNPQASSFRSRVLTPCIHVSLFSKERTRRPSMDPRRCCARIALTSARSTPSSRPRS